MSSWAYYLLILQALGIIQTYSGLRHTILLFISISDIKSEK